MESENASPQNDPKPANPPVNNYYPEIKIERNIHPNRLYAIPLFSLLVKFIILIPVFIEIWALTIATGLIVMIVNPFVVLFTGKYLKIAYDLATGVMRLGAKSSFYVSGVTDKYPGFDISQTPFTWELDYPESPNKLYAIPLAGLLIRAVLIIPFSIFNQIIGYASNLAVFVIITPLMVLIKGYYPETAHELAVDSIRLSNASTAYIFGISDKYPSFNISWKHKTIKIILIIIAVILMLANFSSSLQTPQTNYTTPPPIPTIAIPQIQPPV